MSSIVLIGPADSLPVLRERLGGGAELRAFAEVEALDALDHIVRTKPRVVVLEKGFSSSSRGRALANRISGDASLSGCEVRIMAPEATPARAPVTASATATTGSVAVDEPPKASVVSPPVAATPETLDTHGTRRAPRVEAREGVEVLVDGNPAMLVDISTLGCQVQVLSAKMLKPNQRVRVTLPDGSNAIRCDGFIAWAAFEMPKGQPPRYRVGIELNAVDPEAIAAYAQRHARPA